MKTEESNQAPGKAQADGSRGDVKVDGPAGKGVEDSTPPAELDGKTDSGPEPDVFGQEIPPQD